MRKLIYYVAATQDRFIADKNGGIAWLEDKKWEIPGEDYGYSDFYAGIDTTLMGYNTYAHVMDMVSKFPYENVQNYVFTSHPDPMPCDDVCFVHTDAIGFVRNCKDDAREKNIWLVGGGLLAGEMLRAGLIDELIMTVIPIKLGEGIPLFGNEEWPSSAQLRSTKNYSNGVRKEVWDV
jgi:dihydrofolate reductase